MKYEFFLLAIFIILGGCKSGSSQNQRSDKNVEIVDPDYGVLTIIEKTRSKRTPLMWRCFPIKEVEVKYRTWQDADPLGPYDVIVTMCDFQIFAYNNSIKNAYYGRRAKPVSYCNDFKAAWKKLTHNEEHICLDGETMTEGKPEFDENSKSMVVNWTWDKIKTKKGCYSFWDDYQCSNF